MKTKMFLATVAVAFSFTLTSCGNKHANSEVTEATETVEVEAVETIAPCCKGDSAVCDSMKACCKDKAECKDKAACDKKEDCKNACDKK